MRTFYTVNDIYVTTRSIIINGKDINYHMASMSACTGHYEIGFQVSGSHHTYSTDGEWDIEGFFIIKKMGVGLPSLNALNFNYCK